MRKLSFIALFILTAPELFGCSCSRGFIGRYFLNNINSFDAIVMVEAIAEPIELESNLQVVKVYKGELKESEILRLSGGFCSDIVLANKGSRLILGLFDLKTEEKSFELSTCLTTKVSITNDIAELTDQLSAWGGTPRIGLTRRRMKLKSLERRIRSNIWWNNLI